MKILNIRLYILLPVFLCFAMGSFTLSAIGTIKEASGASMRESIAAIVNSDPITQREVNERISLTILSSNLPDQDDIRDRLRPQILDQLIDEQLMLQESATINADVKDEDIQKGIASVAQSNGLGYDDFLTLLNDQGVKLRTLRRQVRAQIAWSQVIASKLRPRVSIRQQDVDAKMDELRSGVGKQEFLLAEIFLPFTPNNEPQEIEQFATNLVLQMVEKQIPFQRLAQQFSQSAAAARGGDLGWVQEGQLPSELDEAVLQMEAGNLSPPIRTLGGYYILLLRDKRDITADSIPPEDAVKQQIGLERMDRIQRRHLQDLRNAAFIDKRV